MIDKPSPVEGDAPHPVVKRLVSASIFQRMGPGLITGAADDDPGGIATYSQAGAQLRPATACMEHDASFLICVKREEPVAGIASNGSCSDPNTAGFIRTAVHCGRLAAS